MRREKFFAVGWVLPVALFISACQTANKKPAEFPTHARKELSPKPQIPAPIQPQPVELNPPAHMQNPLPSQSLPNDNINKSLAKINDSNLFFNSSNFIEKKLIENIIY